MKILVAKNPKNVIRAGVDTGMIDLEVKFEELQSLGFIPFTASPSDTEAHGRELHARATAGEFGPVK